MNYLISAVDICIDELGIDICIDEQPGISSRLWALMNYLKSAVDMGIDELIAISNRYGHS